MERERSALLPNFSRILIGQLSGKRQIAGTELEDRSCAGSQQEVEGVLMVANVARNCLAVERGEGPARSRLIDQVEPHAKRPNGFTRREAGQFLQSGTGQVLNPLRLALFQCDGNGISHRWRQVGATRLFDETLQCRDKPTCFDEVA